MPGGPRAQITSLTVIAKLWPDQVSDAPTRTWKGCLAPTPGQLWPTPAFRDAKGSFRGHSKGGQDLSYRAEMFCGHRPPTTMSAGDTRSLKAVLNPPFVEWLLGWPIGWTDCTRPATGSYRSWLRTHSSALRSALALAGAAR